MTSMSLSRACFEAEEETKKKCEPNSLPNQIPSSAVFLSAGPNRKTKKKVSTFLRAVLFTRVSAWTPRGIGRQPAPNHALHTVLHLLLVVRAAIRRLRGHAPYRHSHNQRFWESRRRGEMKLGRLERWRRARMLVPDRSFGQFAIPLSDGNAAQR